MLTALWMLQHDPKAKEIMKEKGGREAASKLPAVVN
jgi:hypothetical protein